MDQVFLPYMIADAKGATVEIVGMNPDSAARHGRLSGTLGS